MSRRESNENQAIIKAAKEQGWSLKWLDRGGFGELFYDQKAQIVFKQPIEARRDAETQLIKEIAMHYQLREVLASQNLVVMTQTFEEAGLPGIGFIAPYMDGVGIVDYLMLPSRQQDNEVFFRIFFQLFSAVQFLHEHGFIHRDLRSDNVLVSKSGEVSVIDFGSTERLDKDQDAIKTSVYGMDHSVAPPELVLYIIKKGDEPSYPCSRKDDMYALGVLALTSIARVNPFSEREDNMCLDMVRSGVPPREIDTLRVTWEAKLVPGLPEEVRLLGDVYMANSIKACLDADPSKRPTINQLCSRIVEGQRDRLFFNRATYDRAASRHRASRGDQAEQCYDIEGPYGGM